ncbi:aldehyde dehydrogenase family protein [Nocardioides sp. GXZ039]|uniref:aldehyde dehydrogenase family protein n=1 Tax=Nocardioides sp. GXZ039 TaxID=3136018 RepID=UPI0030F3AA5C
MSEHVALIEHLVAMHRPTTRCLDVLDSRDGTVFARVGDVAVDEVDQYVLRASRAMSEWGELTVHARANVLRAVGDFLEEHVEAIAPILTLENGKVLDHARWEVLNGAEIFRWMGEQARAVRGSVRHGAAPGQRVDVDRRPAGVVLAVTPWNFSLSLVARKVATGLAAGCAVVVKPSEITPLGALVIEHALLECGAPRDLCAVVPTSEPAELVERMLAHPDVPMLTFTGSTVVGRHLSELAARHLKIAHLELGGNAPFIVLDADAVDAAIDGLMFAKLLNSGQTCTAPNRVLVHESCADLFLDRLAGQVTRLRTGDGTDPRSDLGPLISGAAAERARARVREAEAQGARVVCRGVAADGGTDAFFEPVVLDGVEPGMAVYAEENFAPIFPVTTFSTVGECLELANRTRAGLAAYVYGSVPTESAAVVDRLDFGLVGHNDVRIVQPSVPFSGWKESGHGIELGELGLAEYTAVRSTVHRV